MSDVSLKSNPTTKHNAWLRPRLGLKWLLVLTTLLAAFLAGRMSVLHRVEEAETRQREAEKRLSAIMGFQLYSDDDAREVMARIDRLTGNSSDGNLADGYLNPKLTRGELLRTLKVDGNRIPAWSDFPLEVHALSENYWLYFGPYSQDNSVIAYVRISKRPSGQSLAKLLINPDIQNRLNGR